MSSLTMEKVVHYAETFQVKNVAKDFDGTALDVDSHVIELFKPDGTQQGADETSPSGSAGTYTQKFMIPDTGPAGEWSVKWTIIEGGEKTPETIVFKVVA